MRAGQRELRRASYRLRTRKFLAPSARSPRMRNISRTARLGMLCGRRAAFGDNAIDAEAIEQQRRREADRAAADDHHRRSFVVFHEAYSVDERSSKIETKSPSRIEQLTSSGATRSLRVPLPKTLRRGRCGSGRVGRERVYVDDHRRRQARGSKTSASSRSREQRGSTSSRRALFNS